MSVELLQTLSLASFIAAGVFLLVAVALFFLLDVPKLYGEISGRTAKKAIEAIRQQNESVGGTSFGPNPAIAGRGMFTDKITHSSRLRYETAGLSGAAKTEKFATAMLTPQINETTILGEASNETTLLREASNETTLLREAANETTLLVGGFPAGGGETTLLVNEEKVEAPVVAEGDFTIEVEMSFTGSTEIIE